MNKKLFFFFTFILSISLVAQNFTKKWEYDNELDYIGDIDGDGTIEFLDDNGNALKIVDLKSKSTKFSFQDYGKIYYRNLPYELMQPFDFNNNGILDLVINYTSIVDPSTNEIIFRHEGTDESKLFGPEDYDGDGVLEIFIVEESKTIFYSTGLPITNMENIESEKPETFTLSQNYPNPFNPSTQIDYTVVKPGRINLKIYDSNGQLITEFEKNHNLIGNYKFKWNGTNNKNEKVASGIYIYQVIMGHQMIAKKMMLLK